MNIEQKINNIAKQENITRLEAIAMMGLGWRSEAAKRVLVKRATRIMATQLKVGNKYRTPSGLGGVFTIQYKGMEDGKYVFDVLNPDFERTLRMTTLENVTN